MKSLSTQAQSAIDSPYVEPIRLLKIAFESGLILRLCDRTFGAPGEENTFDGEVYEPLIISWGAINHGAIDPVSYSVDPGETEVVIDNTVPVGGASRFASLFGSNDPHYATVEIGDIFGSTTAAADQVFRFKGRVEDVLDMATNQATVVLSGIELDIANRFDHEILTTDDFPSADPDDIGQMFGQGYGRIKRAPFRAVDAGNRTTLTADIGAADTSIDISDAKGFPASGTVQIDAEKITYTGITTNTLTGCARGQSGTTADDHSAGTAVSEVQTEYVYAWGHPIQAIEAVYVDRVRQSGNYTAYTGLSGDEHPTFTGRAVIAFTTMPSLNKQINIEDNISVDQGNHKHGNITYTTLFAETIRTNSGIQYPERIPGNSFETQAFVNKNGSGTFNFLGYKDPGGTPVRWRVGLVYRVPIGSSSARILARFRASDGTTITRYSSNESDNEFHNTVSPWESCSGVTWAEISGGYFTVADVDVPMNWINCSCVWLDIEHTVDDSPADGVAKLGTVALTGNSGADVVIGSQVAADIRGFQDDALGTYTGTAFSLIERPDHICKHMLLDRCGLTSSAIGSSYGDAGSIYAANSYRLGVAILERPNVRVLLNEIATQARSVEFWEAGVHGLAVVGGDVNPAKTLTADRIDQGRTRLKYTPRVDIINRMSARYDREWSGHTSDIASDRSIVNAENAASITKFGALEGDQLSFPFIIDAQQATDVLEWRLKERAFPRLVLEMALGYFGSDLERGDAIGFDFSSGDILDDTFLNLITPGIDFFRIVDTVDGPNADIIFEAVFAASQFDIAASIAAVTVTAAPILVLDFDVAASITGETSTAAIMLARLNAFAATVSGVTQTSGMALENVGATLEFSATITGTTQTTTFDVAIDFDISATITGTTQTTAAELFNPQEFSATITGITQTTAITMEGAGNNFVFEVRTTSPGETFTLPIYNGGTYNFLVEWGDGTSHTITAYNDPNVTHTYASAGTHLVEISGTLDGWSFNASSSASKVYDVQSWGDLLVGSAGNQFNGCLNMTVSATDVLNVSAVTNMAYMFFNANSLNADLSAWDVSNVTDFNNMFRWAIVFNSDLSGWNVSSATNMSYMFANNWAFTSDLSGWNVSSAINTSNMFFDARLFTSDLSAWNVASVNNMTQMFRNALVFTSDLGAWNVASVALMTQMFDGAALTNPHYDSLLIGWDQLVLQSGVSFHAGTAKYSAGAAATARQNIINTYSWTITDGGQL